MYKVMKNAYKDRETRKQGAMKAEAVCKKKRGK
jgi:hypothetical protein